MQDNKGNNFRIDEKRNYGYQAVVPFELVGNTMFATFVEKENGIRVLGIL